MILEDTSTVIYLDGGQGEGLDAEVEALQLLHDAVLRPGLGVAELHDCAGDGGRVLGEGGAAAVRILRPAPAKLVQGRHPGAHSNRGVSYRGQVVLVHLQQDSN